MTKKEYMKPVMRVVELRQKHQLLVGSLDSNGMNTQLQVTSNPDEEGVDKAW